MAPQPFAVQSSDVERVNAMPNIFYFNVSAAVAILALAAACAPLQGTRAVVSIEIAWPGAGASTSTEGR